MKIGLGTIRQSPFVGIFSLATEKTVILPKTVSKKEEKKIENLFGTETIKTSIANSSLIGVLAAGNSKGLITSSIIEEKEEKELQEKGIRVEKIENVTAIGNHLAVNDSKGICSKTFSENQKRKI